MQTPLVNRELSFFMYLLEAYAAMTGMTAAEAFQLWKDRGAIDFVEDSYEMYHQESLSNALADIEHFLASGKPLFA
jgi:hypothetical protein